MREAKGVGKGKGKGEGKVVRRPFVDDLMESQTFYTSVKEKKNNYSSKTSIAPYTRYAPCVQCSPLPQTIKNIKRQEGGE